MQRIDEYQPRGTEVSWQEALDNFEQHGRGKRRVTAEGIRQMTENTAEFESQLVYGVPVLHMVEFPNSAFTQSTAGFAPEQPITGYVESRDAHLIINLTDAHHSRLKGSQQINDDYPEIPDYTDMENAWNNIVSARHDNPPRSLKQEIAHYCIGNDAIEAKLPELPFRRQLASLVVLKAAGIDVDYHMADEHIEKAYALLKKRLATFAFLAIDSHMSNYSGLDLIKTNAVVAVTAEELWQGATEYLNRYYDDECGTGTLRRAGVDARVEWLIDKMTAPQVATV